MTKYLLFIAILLVGCNPCGNDPINAVSSPGGNKVAIAFIRDCGATTGFSTQVSIVKAPGLLPNEAGNVLIVDGKVPLSLKWVGEHRLVVYGSLGVRESRRLHIFEEITVDYQ